MNKVFYRITQDATGTPIEYTGARYCQDNELDDVCHLLAQDYRVPPNAVIVDKIVTVEAKGKL